MTITDTDHSRTGAPPAAAWGDLAVIWHGCFPGTGEQVSAARRAVAGALTGSPGLDAATLIVSELATNAVIHTRSGRDGTFEVTLSRFGDWLRIEVGDEGAEQLPVAGPDGPVLSAGAEAGPGAGPRSGPDPVFGLAESNRGLAIVRALAQRWGCTCAESRTVVWCELALSEGGDAAEDPAGYCGF
jgi:serine/threonine-protein kinase RsbW